MIEGKRNYDATQRLVATLSRKAKREFSETGKVSQVTDIKLRTARLKMNYLEQSR